MGSMMSQLRYKKVPAMIPANSAMMIVEPRVRRALERHLAFLSSTSFFLQISIYSFYFASMIASTSETLLSIFVGS